MFRVPIMYRLLKSYCLVYLMRFYNNYVNFYVNWIEFCICMLLETIFKKFCKNKYSEFLNQHTLYQNFFAVILCTEVQRVRASVRAIYRTQSEMRTGPIYSSDVTCTSPKNFSKSRKNFSSL